MQNKYQRLAKLFNFFESILQEDELNNKNIFTLKQQQIFIKTLIVFSVLALNFMAVDQAS